MELLLVFLCSLLVITIILAVSGFFILYQKIENLHRKIDKASETIFVSARETKETRKTVQLLVNEKPAEVKERKNDIEKVEPEDIPLDESMRIPIVDGVNIQFEGDNESYPVSIN
jgi:predicted Holliday junction resolvase-like endonuclease